MRRACGPCRSNYRTWAEHALSAKHRAATTSVRSSGPAGSHAYSGPTIRVASASAYDAWLEERAALEQPPTLAELPPDELGDDDPDETRTAAATMPSVALLTLAEAAAQLGLAASTLRNQIHNGRLRARLVGKTWTITSAELERYRRESVGKAGRPRKRPPKG
jgi:excisionase family DNA binding protein